MGWVSPTSGEKTPFTPIDWDNISNIYDNNTSTSAKSGSVYDSYASLDLSLSSAVNCDKIRVYHSRSSTTVETIRVYVGTVGSLLKIKDGRTSWGQWVTYYLPEETSVDLIRLSYIGEDSCHEPRSGYAYVHEVEVNRLAVPTVTTNAEPTAKTHNSATIGGNVTDNGEENVTKRGFSYKLGIDGSPLDVSETSADFGTGAYTLGITGLLPATEYYYRAYAVNITGTGYGDWVTFTTDATTPIIETLTCTNIGTTSVTGNGNIIHKGGANVLTRGFCYKTGTTGDPTIADSTVSEGAGAGNYALGAYSLSITGLTPSTDYLIRAYATNSEGTGYGETIALSGYTFTEGADTYFENFYNRCYIVNGEDAVVKYDGSLVSLAGIIAPVAAPTGVGGGTGGSLGVGNYLYSYTYVDDDGYESNGSPVSANIEAEAGEKITLTIANSPDPKVTAKNIYRSQLDDTVLYYDGQVADNTTTTYVSEIADTALGSLLHTDHDAPPEGCHLIAKRLNRIILADDDELVISQLSDVEYFPPAWFQKTGFRQNITGLVPQSNDLPVFTENSVERLIGTDEDNFEFINAYSRKGCHSPRSVVSCDNLLVYLGYDGLYYFDGVTTGTFSHKLNKYIEDNINYDYIEISAATFYEGLYMLSYPKGTSTVNSETVYIDLINRTTGVYDYAFSCYSKWERFGDGNKLFGGSTTEGLTYQIDNDSTKDDTSSIACYDETDFMDFGYPERYKQFYHIYIKVKSTNETELIFYYTLDDGTEQSKPIAIEADTTKWYKLDLEGGGQRGRAIKLRPYILDDNDITYCGYAAVFTMEAEEYS